MTAAPNFLLMGQVSPCCSYIDVEAIWSNLKAEVSKGAGSFLLRFPMEAPIDLHVWSGLVTLV